MGLHGQKSAEEKVHAWMPMEDIEIADLPENVERRNQDGNIS